MTTPVLLIHGQPGRGSNWRPVAPSLDSRLRVLAPDRPGYGDNPAPAGGFRMNAEASAPFSTMPE